VNGRSDAERSYLEAVQSIKSGSARSVTASFDDEVRVRAFEMLRRFGIEYDVWSRWTIDKVEVYVDAWSERSKSRNEALKRRAQEARSKKVDSGIRMVIPFED